MLLRRACLAGTEHELRTAAAQTRVLVFDMGSTTPFLALRFQDLQLAITDLDIHGSPVWEDVNSKLCMYRNTHGDMWIA